MIMRCLASTPFCLLKDDDGQCVVLDIMIGMF